MATILLVDDVELFLELERSFLEDRGHRVVTAASGEEALALVESASPDLLLLDLYLPGIDGDEVCRRLRASVGGRTLPVVMVTAAGKEGEVRKCLAAGCDDYITKPVSKQELVEKVERLLGRVRARTCERVAAPLRVQLQGGGVSLQGVTRDISRNGIYVRSATVMAPGTAVELALELPGGETLSLAGKVKRADEGAEGGMGIYFVHPDPHGMAILDRLVAPGEQPLPAEPAPRPAETDEERLRLHRRIEELEEENREFAERIVHAEEVNNNLTNLYIASSRLHSVLDRDKVIGIVKEVVINFVGADKFALLLCDREGRELRYEAGEGVEGETFPQVAVGAGVLGEALERCESYYAEGPVADGADDPLQPLAAVPLQIHGRPLGLLAVYRLFTQKERFDPIDYQLFSMMAEHAATALFSSTLYEESERKRETYRGFMDLLLK